MKLFPAIYELIEKLVNIGVDAGGDSVARTKSIRLLTRFILFSIALMSVYTVLMYELGFYINSILCLLGIPVLGMNYWLVIKRRIRLARFTFFGVVLFLIIAFSVFFGYGIYSELWIGIMGGISLLIFREREHAIGAMLISVFSIVVIGFCQFYLPPIYMMDQTLISNVAYSNLIFIFSTTYLISYLLRFTNEDFEKRINVRNAELIAKNNALTDSINYARHIQQAVLPPEQTMKLLKRNLLVIYESRDIVSGDYYWAHNLTDRLIFGLVKGPGHGVSGAFTGILTQTLLNQCIEDLGVHHPNEIIMQLRKLIADRKNKWGDDYSEFLEITVCSYNWATRAFTYASNGNSLYLIKHISNLEEGERFLLNKGDRYVMKEIMTNRGKSRESILKSQVRSGEFLFRQDDMLYLTTRGIPDQIGGPDKKEFGEIRLKNLLMSVQHLNLSRQYQILEDVILNWKGKRKQADDITLLGFKV